MKTILIILLTIIAGFCFYTSDPLVLTAPAQIATLMCMLGIGLLIGNMSKGSGKVRKIRKMNKSLLRANSNLRIKNQDLTQKLEEYTRQFLKSNAMNIDLYGAKSENQELKKKVLSLQGNLKQLQQKYEGAKERIIQLLYKEILDDMVDQKEDGKIPSVKVAIARCIPLEELQDIADNEKRADALGSTTIYTDSEGKERRKQNSKCSTSE